MIFFVKVSFFCFGERKGTDRWDHGNVGTAGVLVLIGSWSATPIIVEELLEDAVGLFSPEVTAFIFLFWHKLNNFVNGGKGND